MKWYKNIKNIIKNSYKPGMPLQQKKRDKTNNRNAAENYERKMYRTRSHYTKNGSSRNY